MKLWLDLSSNHIKRNFFDLEAQFCKSLEIELSKINRSSRQAFTLVELLVTIAVIGILASLLLPVLGKAKSQAQGISCLNNLKQLTVGWVMYSDNSNGRLMQNGGGPERPWIAHANLTWGADPDNTNTVLLTDPKRAAMADYVRAPGLYKCPADRYQSQANPGPRVRSVSMNGALNNKPTFKNENGRKYFRAKTMADLSTPGPVSVFVFLDEHADSIDDGIFMVNPGYAPGNESWRNLPASYHNGAGTFSFGDGHCELHKWLETSGDNKTTYPVRMSGIPNAQPWNFAPMGFTSRDYEWLTDRMPYH